MGLLSLYREEFVCCPDLHMTKRRNLDQGNIYMWWLSMVPGSHRPGTLLKSIEKMTCGECGLIREFVFHFVTTQAYYDKTDGYKSNYITTSCEHVPCVFYFSPVTMKRLRRQCRPPLFKSSRGETSLPFLFTILRTHSNSHCPIWPKEAKITIFGTSVRCVLCEKISLSKSFEFAFLPFTILPPRKITTTAATAYCGDNIKW